MKSQHSERERSHVRWLLNLMNLDSYVPIFEENGVDGPTLMNCKTVDDVIELGIPRRAKARRLFDLISRWKSDDDDDDDDKETVLITDQV